MGKAQTTQVEKVPEYVEPTQEEVTLLRGFSDLVGERFGYWVGRRVKQAEMNEATKTEREAVRDLRKAVTGDNLVQIITDADIDGFTAKLKEIEEAQKVVRTKSEPFRTVMKPLAKAIKYMDTVCIPDSLTQLGKPVQERFSLSQWVTDALEAEKN